MGNKVIVSNRLDGAVLAILPKFIGDAINTLPALALLKQLYPTQRICVLVRPHLTEIFSRASEYGLEVISDDRHCRSKHRGLYGMASQLKHQNFALAVLFRGSLTDAVLARLAGIKNVIGYAQNARRPFLSHAFKLNQCHHYIYRYCKLVNDAHGRPFTHFDTPKLTAQPSTLSLSKAQCNIALYLGGKVKGTRYYPQHLAIQVVQHISTIKNINIFLLGDQSEQSDMTSLTSLAQSKGITLHNLAGSMSLAELVDNIGAMDAVISIDSGPMHIAAACGVPCVAIVGHGTSPWSLVAPKTENLIALTHKSTSLNEVDLIQDVSPEKIFQALSTLLCQPPH
ncbi:glycosyltransferase family 9 protein [Pseudoalteromonas luteoviolacea]|uniref:glycosyltransferase family 9 protein n=1 Tax=Pseudoalteromonas luteoviolacea TaxID=43657 RepID=UPI001B38AF41|nr:glycosyltransferase family 9 protein [Pseudoalteromonas luteoviolacea]MBQ4811685.1 glycosyltransferase family 9 protein [Pseudoalteromonas luteoviolacea]